MFQSPDGEKRVLNSLDGVAAFDKRAQFQSPDGEMRVLNSIAVSSLGKRGNRSIVSVP